MATYCLRNTFAIVALIQILASASLIPLASLNSRSPAGTYLHILVDNTVTTNDNIIACSANAYAALGDSYSAGLNATNGGELPIDPNCPADSPKCTTSQCAKNTGAYSYQFWNRYQGNTYSFLACSGANTTDAVTQAKKIPSTTSTVTITIGGNDGDAFSEIVHYCVYEHFLGLCDRHLTKARNTINGIATSLQGVYSNITTQAPGATVVVLGYPQFWPNSAVLSCPGDFLKNPSFDQRTQMNNLVLAINSQIKAAVSKVLPKGIYADVDAGFQGHRMCEQPTYFNWQIELNQTKYPYHAGVFHPNFQGQQQYLAAMQTALKC